MRSAVIVVMAALFGSTTHAAPGGRGGTSSDQSPLLDVVPSRRRPTVGTGADPLGYPIETADKIALLSLLRHRRFEELTHALEGFEGEVTKDARREYLANDGFDAFAIPDPTLGPLLDAWVAKTPRSSAPYAARAASEYALAWKGRGNAYAGKTSRDQFQQMAQHQKRALEDLKRAVKLRPESVAVDRLLLKVISTSEGHAADAQLKSLMERALTVCPLCFQIRVAYLFSLMPRWGGAEDYSDVDRFAASVDPLVPRNRKLGALKGYADLDRCEELQRQDKPMAAAEVCTRAVNRAEHWEFLLARGKAYLRDEQFEKALADFTRTLELKPQVVGAFTGRTRVLARLDRYAEAADDLIHAWALDPTDGEVQTLRPYVAKGLLRTAARLQQADAAGARKLLDLAVRLDPNRRGG